MGLTSEVFVRYTYPAEAREILRNLTQFIHPNSSNVASPLTNIAIIKRELMLG